MKPDIRTWLEIIVVAGLLVAGGLAISSMRAHAKAVAVAAQASGRRMEAALLAHRLADEARAERTRTADAMEETSRERRRADALADSLETVGAVLSHEAVETGESLGEAVDALEASCEGLPCSIPADTVQARLAVHLQADLRVGAAFRAQVGAMVASRIAADSLIGWWEDRSLGFEGALEASERECELCRISEERWREAAEPGFFRDLWGDLPRLLVFGAGCYLAGRGS